MVYTVLFALLLFALCTTLATRSQYIVVLRWPGSTFFLELGADGRYSTFPVTRFPLVVARYAALSTVAAAHATRERFRSWARSHIPSVVGATSR